MIGKRPVCKHLPVWSRPDADACGWSRTGADACGGRSVVFALKSLNVDGVGVADGAELLDAVRDVLVDLLLVVLLVELEGRGIPVPPLLPPHCSNWRSASAVSSVLMRPLMALGNSASVSGSWTRTCLGFLRRGARFALDATYVCCTASCRHDAPVSSGCIGCSGRRLYGGGGLRCGCAISSGAGSTAVYAGGGSGPTFPMIVAK